MKGNIHSTESFGTVDGPGIRYVLFTQGCLLRCKYCHNPDTWAFGSGKEITIEEILKEIEDYLPFINASGGGITVSGGEPLLHLDFIYELFSKLKEKNIHTAIDTSGGCYSNDASFQSSLEKILPLTDLFLLDIKHIDNQKHKTLTGMGNEHILDFANFLSKKNKPVWIRHVLVPGYTDDEKDLENLSTFIRTLKNVKKIELLPYHRLGVYKWKTLNLKYELMDVKPPTQEEIKKVWEWFQ